MEDEPSGRSDRERRARDAYEATARLLVRIHDMYKEAVDEWSRQVETAKNKSAYEVAAAALTSCTMRKAMVADFPAPHCLDGEGRLDMAPGTWRDETAAWAEGMASLESLTAARGSAAGALSSTKTNVPVFVEIGISDAWIEFAASVLATKRTAAGTALDAKPVDDLAALAARLADQSARAMWAEEGHDGRSDDLSDRALASRRAAEAGEQAAENVRMLAEGAADRAAVMRMAAAAVWANAAATWSKAHDRAVAEGDATITGLLEAQAKSAEGHAARLRDV